MLTAFLAVLRIGSPAELPVTYKGRRLLAAPTATA
jgi:hypothetical protein